jgi:hypothetical protein
MAKDAEVPKSTIIKIYATATDEEPTSIPNNGRGNYTNEYTGRLMD